MTNSSSAPASDRLVIHGDNILLESGFSDASIVIENGWIAEITKTRIAATTRLHRDQILCPGLIDTQVNGGGGVLLNNQPTATTLATMIAAHRNLGTTSLLPTLITDAPAKMAAIAEALPLAATRPELLGVHFEGPFLNRDKAGIHHPDHIRPIEQADLDLLSKLTADFPDLRFLLTLAPENISDEAITVLAKAGVILAAGHCTATPDRLETAFKAGLSGFTHLFNAMPPIASRQPGPVAAALLDEESFCGIIADGVHVDPAPLRLALKCKKPGRLFLVTDAMSPAGTDQQSFQIDERTIYRKGGRLTDANGTLAGADLTLPQAIRTMRGIGVDLAEAVRMASTYPADFLKRPTLGRIAVGCRADFTLFDDRIEPVGTWVAGEWRACRSADQED